MSHLPVIHLYFCNSFHSFLHFFSIILTASCTVVPFSTRSILDPPSLIRIPPTTPSPQEAATDRATTLRARAADYLLLALELFETPALEKYDGLAFMQLLFGKGV
jgi:hypothetical protein